MHFRCGLIPVNLACSYIELADLAAFSEFDSQPITAEDHGYSVTRICMPGRGFTRLQNATANEHIASLMPPGGFVVEDINPSTVCRRLHNNGLPLSAERPLDAP